MEWDNNSLTQELIERSGIKDIFILPNFRDFGIEDLGKSTANFTVIVDYAKKAFNNGFYIEYLVLLSNHIEFYLNMYLYVKQKKRKDRLMLGQIINEIKKEFLNQFDEQLLSNIVSFKELRNRVLHNLLFGKIDIQELSSECPKYTKLFKATEDFVVRSIGTKYTGDNIVGIEGDAILELDKEEIFIYIKYM